MTCTNHCSKRRAPCPEPWICQLPPVTPLRLQRNGGERVEDGIPSSLTSEPKPSKVNGYTFWAWISAGAALFAVLALVHLYAKFIY